MFPLEIWFNIIEYLEYKDCFKLTRCCKKFYYLFSDELLIKLAKRAYLIPYGYNYVYDTLLAKCGVNSVNEYLEMGFSNKFLDRFKQNVSIGQQGISGVSGYHSDTSLAHDLTCEVLAKNKIYSQTEWRDVFRRHRLYNNLMSDRHKTITNTYLERKRKHRDDKLYRRYQQRLLKYN